MRRILTTTVIGLSAMLALGGVVTASEPQPQKTGHEALDVAHRSHATDTDVRWVATAGGKFRIEDGHAKFVPSKRVKWVGTVTEFGVTHKGCRYLVADTSLLLCRDGYATTS